MDPDSPGVTNGSFLRYVFGVSMVSITVLWISSDIFVGMAHSADSFSRSPNIAGHNVAVHPSSQPRNAPRFQLTTRFTTPASDRGSLSVALCWHLWLPVVSHTAMISHR